MHSCRHIRLDFVTVLCYLTSLWAWLTAKRHNPLLRSRGWVGGWVRFYNFNISSTISRWRKPYTRRKLMTFCETLTNTLFAWHRYDLLLLATVCMVFCSLALRSHFFSESLLFFWPVQCVGRYESEHDCVPCRSVCSICMPFMRRSCKPIIHMQLLFKSLNTPADLLSQLCQSISLILRLYACSTSTILIASVQRP